MKKIIIFCVALILIACGDDSSPNATNTSITQTKNDLGACTNSNEGFVVWIESEHKGYICSMGNWVYDSQIKNPNGSAVSAQSGTIKDSRDGQTYKTVILGGATWLAQNLNYAIANTDSISSKCYMDDPANCSTNGRLYSRAAAALPNICPDGFEVVFEEAWKWLKNNYESRYLKATEGWAYWNDAINPTNATGLSLQPSGYCTNYNDCSALGYEGRFWSFGEEKINYTAFYYNKNDLDISIESQKPTDHNAIRCVSINLGTCNYSNIDEVKSLLGVYYYCDGQQWWNTKGKKGNIYDYPSNKIFFNPAINYGTLVDQRDGKTYRTTTIGSQVWMAENLNFVTVGGIADDGIGSWCYNNIPKNCNIGGRFYTWATAMGFNEAYNHSSAAEFITTPHRGLCPEGWHVPSKEEFDLLDVYASSMLKSSIGWDIGIPALDSLFGNGTNDLGFTLIHSSNGRISGKEVVFGSGSESATFITSTELHTDSIYSANIISYCIPLDFQPYFNKYPDTKMYLRSLRCVKD